MAHPDQDNCNAVAVCFVQMARVAVYQHPCLLIKDREVPDPRTSAAAERELQGRDLELMQFQELSRYYLLEGDQEEWKRPLLLKKGKHRLGRSMYWQHSTYSFY